MKRRKTKKINYGKVEVGGGAPVSIQSMCTFPLDERDRIDRQINELASAGCEIVRVAVRSVEEAALLGPVCESSPMPVIADVHFDHRVAIAAAGSGAAGLRINPGNIGGHEKTAAVLEAAGRAGIPVRIGVNSGSLEKDLRGLYGDEPQRALCESAMRSLKMAVDAGFDDLVFSLKSSDPMVTVLANRLFSSSCDRPLHIGVTEAGPPLSGTARSAVALTMLLSEGIGDTVRVSLSGDPVNEVVVASAILTALGLRGDFPELISCPTCGRSHIDVALIAGRLERVLPGVAKGMKIAVMGCEVNGPGEAKEADIGVAGSPGGPVLFRGGKVIRKIEGDPVEELLAGIEDIRLKNKRG